MGNLFYLPQIFKLPSTQNDIKSDQYLDLEASVIVDIQKIQYKEKSKKNCFPIYKN